MSARIQTVVLDNLGIPFDPNSLPHNFEYNADGSMATDTCVEAGSIVRVKTYTYTTVNGAQVVESVSAWVRQAL